MSEEKKKPEQGEQKKAPVELPSIDQLREELSKEQYRHSYNRILRSTIFSLLVVAAVAVLLAVLLLPVLRISGTSMTETLSDGDIVVAITGRNYDPGDVVAFYYNNSILVKRVIATAGDWVDIKDNGDVYVNDELLDEPYVNEKALGECDLDFPYQVPDQKNFLMGDHRATSIDSRSSTVGCVDNGLIIGKIVFRVWPMASLGLVR